jgi:hypothetical protein
MGSALDLIIDGLADTAHSSIREEIPQNEFNDNQNIE